MCIWIYWYVCISHLCQCAMCQVMIIISCIYCCLATILSLQYTTNNTPNDESMYKIFWFVHGQLMKLLLKRSIMGFTFYTTCVVQQTRNTNTAMGLKTRTKALDLALKQRTRALTSRQRCSQTSNIGFFKELQVNSQHLPKADKFINDCSIH